jgi:hypothetical protein
MVCRRCRRWTKLGGILIGVGCFRYHKMDVMCSFLQLRESVRAAEKLKI